MCVGITAAAPFISISEEEWIKNGDFLRQKMGEACRRGFFYLEVPADCKPLIGKTVEFAHNFYKDPAITSLQLPGHCGFHKRPWQAESLFLEDCDWKQYLPQEASELAKKMHALSIQILKSVLQTYGIPEQEWSKGTGGLTDDKGWIHFCFNHYRPEIEGEGMEQHKDMGHVAVLYIDQEGLEVCENGKWMDLPHKANHFVINLGRALELCVGKELAVLHRVRHVSDRISFGSFTDNHPSSSLMGRTPAGELINLGPYMDYIHHKLTPTLNEVKK